MSVDIRYSNHHLIQGPYEKWSTEWTKFSGLPFAFGFELVMRKSGNELQQMMKDNWSCSIGIAVVYLVVIYSLKLYMKQRQPFKLKLPMIIWNCSLSIFSLTGLMRCLPEFVSVLVNKGFKVLIIHPITFSF